MTEIERPSVRAIPLGRPSVLPLVSVCALMGGYALFFGWLSLERYWAYQMHAQDMGNMGQAAWNTVHGHPFYFTNIRLPYHNLEAWGTTTRLSFHVEAVYPVISLVYLVYPHPESLLVLQTVALACGALGVFLLARDVLNQPWLAAVFAAVYLLFPSLEGMNLYEFHLVSLATPLLIFAFLFAYRRQYAPFVLCCLAAMGTKEQIGLIVAMFGLYVALVHRDWAVGLGTVAVGVIWSLFAALVIERHYRQPGTLSYLHSRYGYLGHGVREALDTVLRHPSVLSGVVFTWAKAAYVGHLLAPVGLLAVFAAPLLALALPSLALDLLSTNASMYSALGDNSAEIISVVLIASILGCRVVLTLLTKWVPTFTSQAIVAVYLLAASLWTQRLDGFTPLGERFQVPVIGAHQHVEDRFVSMIPSSVPVSTQDELDPHLSSRHYLYLFEDTGRPPDPPLVPANFILLDVSGPTYPLTSTELHLHAAQYIHRGGWGVAAAEDGLILIKKGAARKRIPARFYSFMRPTKPPDHPLNLAERGAQLTGYDREQVDLPNFRIPRLAYTFYLRATRQLRANLQPVLYERIGNTINCSSDPLGLAWMPTSRWVPDTKYVVRLGALETNRSSPATAHFYVDLQPMPGDPARPPACQMLWRHHGRLAPAGELAISL